jgi:hypothetical protein
MLYRRTHTRDLDALSEMNLSQALPSRRVHFRDSHPLRRWASRFQRIRAEITISDWRWKTYPSRFGFTGAGMVLVAAFTLRAAHKVFLW